MKKTLPILFILVAGLLTLFIYHDDGLSQDLKQSVLELYRQLKPSLTEINTQQADLIYKRKSHDGSIIFSDTKKKGSAEHRIDKGNTVFIDMKMDGTTSHSKPDDKSPVDAVLDPVNNINNEAAKNVEKMRKVKQQKLTEQGI